VDVVATAAVDVVFAVGVLVDVVAAVILLAAAVFVSGFWSGMALAASASLCMCGDDGDVTVTL